MTSKKQRVRLVIFMLLLVLAIVASVFAISYFKNGYTAPWIAAASEPEEEAVQEVALTIVEKEEPKEESVKKEEPKKEDEAADVSEPEVEAEPEVKKLIADVDYYGALHVTDGKLCDTVGNQVQLLGVSTHGISWFPEYASKETIAYLKNTFGINVIRVAMYSSDYNGYCVGGPDVQAALKDTIDEAVLAATENSMYVIIDWHILNDGNPNEYKSDAIQFFGEMVRRYKDNENVIYEICNEPNGDTTWADIKKYANEVIPVIRGVDSDAIILVGTPNWCQDISVVAEDPLDFANIMYTYHFYAATHKSKFRNDFADALDNGIPVFVSEFGLVEATGDGAVDEKESEKWLEMIEEYGVSACVWNLSNKAEGSALINMNCDKIYDFTVDDLSEQGQYLYKYFDNKETKNNDN